jgi:hypothetical protein
VCVGCLDGADCPADAVCGADGRCHAGCDVAMGKTCPTSQSCCQSACTDTFSDPRNCGGCGVTCSGALTQCCNGVCVDPQTNPSHCGGCALACNPTNDLPVCTLGACAFQCIPGYAHCAMGNTGCETRIDSILNCGGCGVACSLAHALDGRCDGARCSYTCKPGFADCLSAAPDTDGCESDLTTPAHCGACDRACDMVQSVGAVCSGGACTYAGCVPGFADCTNAPPDLDGCETATNTTSNCGGCNQVCNPVHATTASCDGRTCSYVCQAGYADCINTAPDLDGCETSINDLKNCGGCGNACSLQNCASTSCDGRTCSYVCNQGFHDCNAAVAPDLDGCECNTPGCCANACQSVHANGVGQSYYDCTAPGTINATQAHSACGAFTGDATVCTSINCGAGKAICGVANGSCVCWNYSGTAGGHVFASKTVTCTCASAMDPVWN